MTKKICISGYYGFDNFGDETILKILVENLKSFNCNPLITVFSSNPTKTSSELNIDSVHSFNIKEVIKKLIDCDCLISGGGSLLQDTTSIKSLVYYLGILSLAQFFGKKTIIFAQGIGPINNSILKNLACFVLKKANLITVRDDNSLNLLKSKKINAIKCNDPVWNLPEQIKINQSNKIGVQLRDFSNISSDFVIKLAKEINKHYAEKQIKIFSLQNNIDLQICNQLKEELLKINSNIDVEVIENSSNEKIVKDITELDELIAMRFHACLIALKSGIKLLPINYDIKVETLSKEFNINTLNLDNIEEIEKVFEEFASKQQFFEQQKIKEKSFNFEIIEKAI